MAPRQWPRHITAQERYRVLLIIEDLDAVETWAPVSTMRNASPEPSKRRLACLATRDKDEGAGSSLPCRH
jgi:hypothetical protein